jgi:CRISPR/Cas system CSM-associated protein Csm3 (group 7 of RAMP superfamily)
MTFWGDSMSEARGLLSLRRRIWADCEIELLEPLRVGAGKDQTSPIDLPILRDSRGRPVIPGSTLKGFFRSYLSRLLLAYKISGSSLIEVDGIKVGLEPCIDSISEKIDAKKLEDLCLIDRMFGYSGRDLSLSSLIKFTEASPVDTVDALSRTHVSLNRERDAAERGALVKVEAVKEYEKSPTRFRFTIIFDELSDPQFSGANNLFMLLLKLLHKGLEEFIGGWRSRGYGRVRMKLIGIRVADVKDLFEGNVKEVNLADMLGR